MTIKLRLFTCLALGSFAFAQQTPILPTSPAMEKICSVLVRMEGWRDFLDARANDPLRTPAQQEADRAMHTIASKRVERLLEAKSAAVLPNPVLNTDPNYTENAKPDENGKKPAACTMPLWLDRVIEGQDDFCLDFRPGVQDYEEVVFDTDIFDQDNPIQLELAVCHEMWRLEQDLRVYYGTLSLESLADRLGLPGEHYLSIKRIKDKIEAEANSVILLKADASYLDYLASEVYTAGSPESIAAAEYADKRRDRAADHIFEISRLTALTAIPQVQPACPIPILPI